MGLRVEYVRFRVRRKSKSSNIQKRWLYLYLQPFPNLDWLTKLMITNKLSLFYNRRVDRPNEVDIRIFPKYDDAEIIKVGNPALASTIY